MDHRKRSSLAIGECQPARKKRAKRPQRKSIEFPLTGGTPPLTKRGKLEGCTESIISLAPKFGIDLNGPGDLRYNRYTKSWGHRAVSFGWQGPCDYKFGGKVYPKGPLKAGTISLYRACCENIGIQPMPLERLGVCFTAYVGKQAGEGVQVNDGLSYHKDDEPIHAMAPVLMVTAAVGPGKLERSLSIRTETEIHHVRLCSGSVFLGNLCELEHGVQFKSENRGQVWCTLTFRLLKT